MTGPRRVHTFSRRQALLAPIPVLGLRQATPEAVPEVWVHVGDPQTVPFRREEFGFVGVYDVDWLTTPEFAVMLDNLSASPGAFSGVRFFGALTAGKPERFKPEGGGTVWTDADGSIDFTSTLAALEALTSHGLTPFIVLSFFPPAVSPSPITPPKSWVGWRHLVRTFLEEVAADPRFGPERIAEWWFEVWNEPNEGRFWSGSQEDYFDLYRATSEAVAETGLAIRLGGPAIAYKPQVSPDDGSPWMARFLRFIASDPDLQCDFISLHRKGTVQADPPDLARLYDAAEETAELALMIDPTRFAGITIINNEADEKVGFEVPYQPRLDQTAAAWLGSVTVIHASLNDRYQSDGIRFLAAADNANLQLMEAPFDGRRSIMTFPGEDRTDLVKLPVYGYYELLRLMGDRQVPVTAGAEQLFPQSDIYHGATAADRHVAAQFMYYPDPEALDPIPRSLEYVVADLPWAEVNVAVFRIDRDHSNAYTAAGGSSDNPYPVPDPADIAAIRRAQEVTVARPISHGVTASDGTWRERLTLAPYSTVCLWITPHWEDAPAAPAWLEVDAMDDSRVLRWEPSTDPAFYSFEVYRLDGDTLVERLSPVPLRAALWIDDAPAANRRAYGVRTLSASGVASLLATTGC